MEQRELKGPTGPVGRAINVGGGIATNEHEAILAYVQRLDHVVAEAREPAIDAALATLDRLDPPPGLPTGHLLERKRRELLGRFDRVRHQILAVAGGSLDAWLVYFLASADLAGCEQLELRWRLPTYGGRATERIPVAEGRAWRERLAGTPIGAVAAIAHVAPGDQGQALLDVEGGWLTLHGPPFFVAQSQKVLDRAIGRAPLALALTWEHTKEVLEGAGLATRLVVSNVSDDVLILDVVGTDLPHDATESFRRASLGTLHHDPIADSYGFDATAPAPTPAAFYNAALRPGQARTIMLVVKMLEGGDAWREVRVRYARLTQAEFGRLSYIPALGRTDAFPPVIAYQRLDRHPDPEHADLTSVLIPSVPDAAWHESAWAFPFHAARRRFSLAQARAKVGADAQPVHYSRWQQAWIMAARDGCAVVAPSRVSLYPRVDPASFALIDDAEQRVPIRFDDRVLATFRSLPLGITDWESHALGLSVSLPKLKLTSLFQEVDRLGCAMGVGRNLLGRPTLVIGP